MDIKQLNDKNTIHFNFTYAALELLGKNLYSNVWNALSELVANGIDAKAKEIKILIDMTDKEHSTIDIYDNGSGMDYLDLANRYVLLGRNKRDDLIDNHTIKYPMGRKGIGKLAALYLSKDFYIITKKDFKKSTWNLNLLKITDNDIPNIKKVESRNDISELEKDLNFQQSGTILHLTDVDMSNIGVQTINAFKARLADFYLVNSLDCSISVALKDKFTKKEEIVFDEVKKSIAYKNFFALYDNSNNNIQKYMKKNVVIKSSVPSVEMKLRNTVFLNQDDYPKVSGEKEFVDKFGNKRFIPYNMVGWIAMHSAIEKDYAVKNDPLFMKNNTYRPNQLRVYIRNKLAVANFLPYLKNTQIFGNYIEGEISFDILDDDFLPDITTSNRQDLQQEDERVVLLIEILKPIINKLISERIKVANDIKKEEELFFEKQKLELQKIKDQAELKVESLEKDNKSLKYDIALKNKDLKSEKKRNSFLNSSLRIDQKEFMQRLHMFQINLGTINNIIAKWIKKHSRNNLKIENILPDIKTISYTIEKMRGNLKYSSYASFNTQDEYIEGDLFAFINEFCKLTYGDYKLLNVYVNNPSNLECQISFSPQDISVIICNIVSNSEKHRSKNLFFELGQDSKGNYSIKAINDGKPFDFNTINNKKELFEFGKGFTPTGNGVGLYHIRNIIETKMNGQVDIDDTRKKGFEIQMRFKNERLKNNVD